MRPFTSADSGSVEQEAEDVVDDQRIVDLLRVLVGLADEDNRRALLRVEEAFHSGNGCGLIFRNVAAVEVAGGKDLDDAGDEAGDDADFQEEAAEFLVALFEQVERAGGRDHETMR